MHKMTDSSTRRPLGGVRSIAVALAVVMTLGLVPTANAGAVTCFLGVPANPYLEGAKVASDVAASCTASVNKTLELSVRRLRTGFPDSVAASAIFKSTTNSWSLHAAGCEPSAAGSSHRYQGRGKFSGLSDTVSNIVWKTCS